MADRPEESVEFADIDDIQADDHIQSGRCSRAGGASKRSLTSSKHTRSGKLMRRVRVTGGPKAGTHADEAGDVEVVERRDEQHSDNARPGKTRRQRSLPSLGTTRAVERLRQLKEGVGKGEEEVFETPRTKMRNCVKEVLLYLLFLTLFLVIVLSSREDYHSYYFADSLKEVLIGEEFDGVTYAKTMSDVANAEELFQWLQGPFLSALYADEWYNGRPYTEDESHYIAEYARLIGTIRIRQLRVRNDSCIVPGFLVNDIPACYGKYSGSNEDQAPFGPEGKYVWQSASELGEWPYNGRISKYQGSGYIVELGRNQTEAAAAIQDLHDNLWIDRQTRAVFVDFTAYNGNLNLFCVSRILFEFPASGGLVQFPVFRTLKVYRYVTNSDFIILGVELVFCLMVLYYLREEVLELYRFGWAYLHDFWNYFDLTNLAIFGVVIVLRITSVLVVNNLTIEADSNTYYNYQWVGFLMDQEKNLNSVNGFLMFFKIFKYLQFSRRMSQLSRTLTRAGGNLLSFLAMFFIVFVGYSLMGFMAFGSDVVDYRSLDNAMLALFRAILGDFDFAEIQEANRFLGPMFFISYMVLVFFILMNMFLAIINSTYDEIQTEDAELGKLDVKENMAKFFEALDFRKKTEAIKEVVKDMDNIDIDRNQEVNKTELQTWLDKSQLARDALDAKDAEEIMAKYDVNKDGILDEQEKALIKAELEQRAAALEARHDKTLHEANKGVRASASVVAAAAVAASGGADTSVPATMGEASGVLLLLPDLINDLSNKLDRMQDRLVAMERMQHSSSSYTATLAPNVPQMSPPVRGLPNLPPVQSSPRQEARQTHAGDFVADDDSQED